MGCDQSIRARKSAALQQLEQLVNALRARRQDRSQLDFLQRELSDYLDREIERFQKYGELFPDPETREGFADVVAALERLRELADDLSLSHPSPPDSEWEATLEDARDADRLLSEASDFLQA